MSRQPDPWKSLRDEFRKLQDQIRRMQAASPFFGTGFHPNGNNGIESDDFDGDLAAGNAGTKGWAFNSTRAAIGELFLRPGSVTNDALASPVSSDAATARTEGVSLSTTSTVKVSVSITVPAGFTTALVRADALGEAVNTTASPDYIYVDANINGVTGGETYNSAASGYGGSALGGANQKLTGLSGGDIITCTAMSRTGFAGWAANASNLWTITAQVIFLR